MKNTQPSRTWWVRCEVVLRDEFMRDVVKADADKFWAVEGGAEVEVSDVKGANLAPALERTLLIISLISLRGAVLVPTSPG